MLHPPIQQRLWIETGYRHFAEQGPSELKIKNIAHDAGVSRTTFYHFFRIERITSTNYWPITATGRKA